MSDTSKTIPVGSTTLLDEEVALAKAHREKISRITLAIEEMFLKEELTMGDLLEIFGMFTARANKVFESITLNKIKDDYDRPNQ
jgi:hypothetical protein